MPLFAALFALLCVCPQALAAHVTCGEVITRDTTLDSDLLDCSGNGLVIGAGHISLDLNGHTIDGVRGQQPFPGPAGIDNGEGHDAVEVRGPGTVRDFDIGVLLFNTDRNLLHRFQVSATYEGIYLDGPAARGNVFARNVLTDNFSAGIRVADYCSANIAAGDNRLERNTAFKNGRGIILSGCADGNVISRNTAFENGDGFLMSDSFGETVIEKNELHHNLDTGLDSIELQNARIERNDLIENGGDGIAIDDHNNLIGKNVANGNGDDGIDVPAENTVTRNTTNHNGDLGIEAMGGVIDGGGNRAFGNGNPLQCLNVRCR